MKQSPRHPASSRLSDTPGGGLRRKVEEPVVRGSVDHYPGGMLHLPAGFFSRNTRVWRRIASGALVVGGLLLPRPATANDTSVGGTGVDLQSLKESSVQMLAEDITLTHEDGSFTVVAKYTFENPKAEDVKLQVGFPEVGCPKEDEGDCHAKSFRGLTTEVDGKRVKHRKGSLKQTERWAKHLGTFWLFDVTFPPKKAVSIVHRYSMDATLDSMGGVSVSYVTRTGSTWARPIGRALFRFRVPPYATYLRANETLGPPKNPRFVRDGEHAYTEIVFEKKNWTPEGDLDFGFATAFGQFPVPRLDPDALSQRAKGLGLQAADLCPWTGPYGSPPPETAAQAQSCRNLIYASWGYPFKKKEVHDLFYDGGKGWHVSTDYGAHSLMRDPAPSPDFSMAWTARSERQLLQDISRTKDEKGEASSNDDASDEPTSSPAVTPPKASPKSAPISAAPPPNPPPSGPSPSGCAWTPSSPKSGSWPAVWLSLVMCMSILGRAFIDMERAAASTEGQGQTRGCQKPFEASLHEGLERAKGRYMSLKGPVGTSLRRRL